MRVGNKGTTEISGMISSAQKTSRLSEIQKRRKDSIAVESEDAKDLLKSFARNFSQNEELLKLLDQTLNLDIPPKGRQKETPTAQLRKNSVRRKKALIHNDFRHFSNDVYKEKKIGK